MAQHLILTRHALIRASQRGITNEQIRLALSHGATKYVKKGRRSFTLNDRTLANCPGSVDVSHSRGVRVIVQNGVVITVMKANRVARRPGINRRMHLLHKLQKKEDRYLLANYR